MEAESAHVVGGRGVQDDRERRQLREEEEDRDHEQHDPAQVDAFTWIMEIWIRVLVLQPSDLLDQWTSEQASSSA